MSWVNLGDNGVAGARPVSVHGGQGQSKRRCARVFR